MDMWDWEVLPDQLSSSSHGGGGHGRRVLGAQETEESNLDAAAADMAVDDECKDIGVDVAVPAETKTSQEETMAAKVTEEEEEEAFQGSDAKVVDGAPPLSNNGFLRSLPLYPATTTSSRPRAPPPSPREPLRPPPPGGLPLQLRLLLFLLRSCRFSGPPAQALAAEAADAASRPRRGHRPSRLPRQARHLRPRVRAVPP